VTVIRPPTRPQSGTSPSRDGSGPWRDRATEPVSIGVATRAAAVHGPSDDVPPGITPLLRLVGVHVFLDGSHVLRGVSLTVGRGEIVALLGANGAGKTTTLRAIHGFVHPQRGRIDLAGRNVSRVPTHELVRLGVGQAPEHHRVFRGMSVLENLQMGAYSRDDHDAVAGDVERILEQFPLLGERRHQDAGTLSGGEQQMLVIGRALMARPSLLLLDEPTADLAPILVDRVFAALQAINEEGVTILLAEQNTHRALSIASRGYVLQTGRVVRSGLARELADDPEVRAAYLGR
jgi:branched-chain amino acid transport system ATP-binding protein